MNLLLRFKTILAKLEHKKICKNEQKTSQPSKIKRRKYLVGATTVLTLTKEDEMFGQSNCFNTNK